MTAKKKMSPPHLTPRRAHGSCSQDRAYFVDLPSFASGLLLSRVSCGFPSFFVVGFPPFAILHLLLDSGLRMNSPCWTIPIRTIHSLPKRGKEFMEKSIYSREYRAVTRLLKESREKAGVTQVDLAEALGQSQSFVSKCERGERRLDIIQLRTLCGEIGLTLPEFVESLEKALRSRK